MQPVSPLPHPTVIRVWLWIVALMILGMVVVGGATRLTESGLSITEWKPISGVVPPLDPAAWQAEFDHYKAIPQYARLFPDMDLAGFKSIFWWEWSHRLLGRLIGAVVAVPLALFWLAGWLNRDLKIKLVGLLLLGALQGAIGWWMVASGLSERTEVSQYRLAIHLLTASLTLVLAVWFAEGLPIRQHKAPPVRLRVSASVLLAAVFVQLGLGALVAGLRAGRIYNTWPLMGDGLIPPVSELGFIQPWWRNIFENATTAQFDHRLMAYVLFVAAVVHAIDARRAMPGTPVARGALWLALAVTLQAALGVATLLSGVRLDAALTHQAVAMVVLILATLHRSALRPARDMRVIAPVAPDVEIIGLPAFAGRVRVAR